MAHLGGKLSAVMLLLGAIIASALFVFIAISLPPPIASLASPRQLTFSSGAEVDPAVSPNGQAVAYASDATGVFQIWTVRLDGRHAQQLTYSDSDSRAPQWSPDGGSIFYLVESGPSQGLWRIGIDGNNRTLLAGGFNVSSFSVSSDSRDVLFDAESQDAWGIYLARMPEGFVERLFGGRYPSWSPDGSSVIYSELVGSNYVVVVRRLDGSDAKALTDSAYSSIRPAYVDNGTSFVFLSDQFSSWAVWTADANGSNPRVVGTFNLDIDPSYTPSVSVSASRIALGARAPDGSVGLLLFLLNPPAPADLPFRGLYDAPVGLRLGTAGQSTTAPSLSRDETVVAYSSVVGGSEHVWIISSKTPLSPYGG